MRKYRRTSNNRLLGYLKWQGKEVVTKPIERYGKGLPGRNAGLQQPLLTQGPAGKGLTD